MSSEKYPDSLPARPVQITVIGDSNADDREYHFAEELGMRLAKEGFTVITGGRGGAMEAVNKGAMGAGGISVGILPSDSLSAVNAYCNVVVPTGMGHARNVITALAADAIVSLGGGAGTLTEISFGWIHQRPIFVFTQFGGWSELVADRPLDSKSKGKIVSVTNIEDLIEKLRNL